MKHTDEAQREESILRLYLERVHRWTWEVDCNSEDEEGQFDTSALLEASPKGTPTCLHAIGLELYGHVSES